ASCGCFGAAQASASPLQAAISAALAAVCAWVALHPVGDIASIFNHSPLEAVVLGLGIITAVYATVIAYTELPAAWGSWSGQ
ncbi:hypothetical protein, partial [Staphylococcus aureus]